MLNVIILRFEIENIELNKLYETGKSKLIDLPKKVIEKFFLRLECIMAAYDFRDIENDEVMDLQKGKFKDHISLRLIEDWRLEAALILKGSPVTIEGLLIKEIVKQEKLRK